MEKETRSAIERVTQRARLLLEQDFSAQLEGTFDILRTGVVAASGGAHMSARQRFQRDKIVAAIEHKLAAGMTAPQAIADYIRDAAFTTLNRFVALKMLEAREILQECITKGDQSAGFREFCGLAPGLALLPEGAGYRLYVESLFDELSTEVKVLFDRGDAASALWPKRGTFDDLLELLNAQDVAQVWSEDETIGWVYQYFNSLEERQSMKDVKSGGSQTPRNSRELGTRNQFFTPRYIVRFLTDNTLGRLWWEMRGGDTELRDRCEYLAIKPSAQSPRRPKKDPRDLRIIDPACGSGHFLLYGFDLLLEIYNEAWADSDTVRSSLTGRSIRDDYPEKDGFDAAVPELIIRHNLYGVDIDPRCVQVTSFALWLRAQRAFNELHVPRGGRRRVERGHVILAEPMPGDPKLVREFAAQAGPPILSKLFEDIVSAFRLAGELGIMLRVERTLGEAIRSAELSSRQGNLFTEEATAADFWETAEAKLLEALAKFETVSAGRDHERRRMFRHDSAHGFALLDAARTTFDVVLMNPPFGDPSAPSKAYVEAEYPDSRQDIFAVFVDRCVRDLAPNGLLGVISTDAGFYRRTLEPWRRNVLLGASAVEVFAHLGDNVLDTARVRVAAYALSTPRRPRESTFFLRAYSVDRESRQPALEGAVRAIRTATPSSRVFETEQREFEKLPYAVFSYWCSPELRDIFINSPALEGTAGHARQGLATADDFRFLRLRWEVNPERVGRDKWMPFAKGGEYCPFYDDVHLLLAWTSKGRELIAWGKSVPRNIERFGKSGITWPLRTRSRFSPRALPEGCAFGHKGPVVVDVVGDAWTLLALMNSRPTAYFLSFGTGALETVDVANSYEVGLVQRLPVPKYLTSDRTLSEHAQRAWVARAEGSLRDETASLFVAPTAPVSLRATLADTWVELIARGEQRLQEYVASQEEIDRRTCELYGLTSTDWSEVEENVGAVHHPDVPRDDRARRTWAESLLSFLVGCSFGRWSPSRLTLKTTLAADQAFSEVTAQRDEVSGAPSLLVDDPGHPLDIARRCESALEEVIGQRARQLLDEAAQFLGVGEVRRYLQGEFFDSHLSVYSKSRRSAPIYLPIATTSGRYVIWLYLHRLSDDSLFSLHSEMILPKLALEEGRLRAMLADGELGAAARKQLAHQQALVDELRELTDELRRVTALWRPNLDDGVVIQFAPLWRLVPHHKAWQKELKATWDRLCDGQYDWAQLAMRLWPERVVPKCAGDRSLAIAHGVEDVFWAEGADGKWKARATPSMSIDQLVSERSSSAVKAALKSLLDAPTASGTGRARGRRAAASATTDGGVS